MSIWGIHGDLHALEDKISLQQDKLTSLGDDDTAVEERCDAKIETATVSAPNRCLCAGTSFEYTSGFVC